MARSVIRNTSRVSLEALELFVAIVQSESIAGAARQWQMSPSLATRKIAALERELKAHLFDRTTRKIHLTEAGRATLKWARETLSRHGALADELDAIQRRLFGTIRIVSNEYLISSVLPDFITTFSSKFPEIRFVLSVTDSVVPSEKRDYDLAIYSGRLPDSNLKGIRIRNFQRILCASPAYLKRRGAPTKLPELLEHDCLLHEQAEDGCWTFKRDGRAIKQKVNPIVLSASHLPLMALARNGMGIMQISRGAVHRELAEGELVPVLTGYECVNSDGSRPATWAVFPGEREVTRTKLFVAELTKYVRGLPD